MEVVKRGETTLKNGHVLTISFFNLRVVKKERDRVSFPILNPTIYSNTVIPPIKRPPSFKRLPAIDGPPKIRKSL